MKRGAYYNENDPYCVQWLRNLIANGLIADGDVDNRDIRLVQPEDVRGYRQAHFFAGIGGWSYALRLAQWPDNVEVWTGSCPCQPFSSAARGRAAGELDARDLWPEWRRLVAACKPAVVLGEQVPKKPWLNRAARDLEAMGRNFWAAGLGSVLVGKDHGRKRFYFASNANGNGKPSMPVNGKMDWLQGPRGESAGMGAAHGVSPRMATMRAFGNAIDPQVAAQFIAAARDYFGGQIGAAP